jgi:hypothetical protein
MKFILSLFIHVFFFIFLNLEKIYKEKPLRPSDKSCKNATHKRVEIEIDKIYGNNLAVND